MSVFRQLLLIDRGEAEQAKHLLEARIQRISINDIQGEDVQSNDDLEKEAIGLGRCYVLDTLCGALRDWESAATWLKEQLKLQTLESEGGPEPPLKGIGRSILPRREAEKLLLEVEERRTRAQPSRIGSMEDKGGRTRSLEQKQSTVTRSSSVADVPPDGQPDPYCCTMTGSFLDDGCDSSAASAALRRETSLDAEASRVRPKPKSSLTTVSNKNIKSESPKPISSILHVHARWWPWFKASFFRMTQSLRYLQPYAITEWKCTVGALISCTLLFALVAESRSLGMVARQWWRQVRLALRTLAAELMSLSLTLSPSPLSNGYHSRTG